jgi:hypothetical protein
LRFFTAVTMKNAVFWDVEPSRSCVNRRFGGTYRLHLQRRKIGDRGTSMSRWLQPAFFIINILRNSDNVVLGLELRRVKRLPWSTANIFEVLTSVVIQSSPFWDRCWKLADISDEVFSESSVNFQQTTRHLSQNTRIDLFSILLHDGEMIFKRILCFCALSKKELFELF